MLHVSIMRIDFDGLVRGAGLTATLADNLFVERDVLRLCVVMHGSRNDLVIKVRALTLPEFIWSLPFQETKAFPWGVVQISQPFCHKNVQETRLWHN